MRNTSESVPTKQPVPVTAGSGQAAASWGEASLLPPGMSPGWGGPGKNRRREESAGSALPVRPRCLIRGRRGRSSPRRGDTQLQRRGLNPPLPEIKSKWPLI